MMVGIFSYMADITTESERTVRIGIISLVYSVGVPFGMAFSGILLRYFTFYLYLQVLIQTLQKLNSVLIHIQNRKVGFYGVFSMAGTLYLVALLYGIFLLKEVPFKPKEDRSTVRKSFLADFFDLNHIKETFAVAFRSGAQHRRVKILALMAVVIIVVGPQHGKYLK